MRVANKSVSETLKRLIDVNAIAWHTEIIYDESGTGAEFIVAYKEQVDQIPTVRPRAAHWVPNRKHPCYVSCSECGFEPPDLSTTQDLYDNRYAAESFNFCPECGARMEEK